LEERTGDTGAMTYLLVYTGDRVRWRVSLRFTVAM
jgi:hypothetical protein